MTDRELIQAAYAIQLSRGWSIAKVGRLIGAGRTTWERALSGECLRLYGKTRRRLVQFVTEWSDRAREESRPDQRLVAEARAIQMRRNWSNATCSQLSGIPWSTWQGLPESSFVRRPVQDKLRPFIDAWRDDSRIGPAPKRWRVLNFHRSKVAA